MKSGHVYLVGAGPGDPGLITRKALDALRAADVVVYDRLIAPALLGDAPLEAERICAAKSPEGRRLSQEGINNLLIDQARAGKIVVRLKGGDPYVFGRGGEEALCLRGSGIPVTVIPGVSSVFAVPAAAGIPLTHRNLARGFAVWTAHRSDGASADVIDAPTQVILMGMDTLPRTVADLLARGRPPTTPVAVISWGTTARQHAVVGTLEDIEVHVASAGISSPATIVVGDVVALAAYLDGENRPAGRRIVFTRRREVNDPDVEELERAGHEIACLPVTVWPRGERGERGERESAEPLPANQVIGAVIDLVEEAMIDEIVFDSRRSLGLVRTYMRDRRIAEDVLTAVAIRVVESEPIRLDRLLPA